jgi:hypothetical protein
MSCGSYEFPFFPLSFVAGLHEGVEMPRGERWTTSMTAIGHHGGKRVRLILFVGWRRAKKINATKQTAEVFCGRLTTDYSVRVLDVEFRYR